MRGRAVDVLCGYALEVVVSSLRGVRGVLGRLLAGDDRSAIGRASVPVAEPRPWTGRDRLPDEVGVRDALANPTPLPATYGDDRLVLLARDPRTLFAYWDLTPWSDRPPDAVAARLVLRVEDLTFLDFEEAQPWQHQDVPVDRLVGSHYVEVGHAAGTFRAEVGWRWPNGAFVARVRSEVVTTARADMPGHDPLRWLTVRPASTPGDPRLTATAAPPSATAPNGPPRAGEASRRRAPSSEEPYRRGG